MEYEFDDNNFPLAYLITLRSYGTWLHGDEKLSVDRHGLNVYDTPRREANSKIENLMREEMKQKPLLFSENQRAVIERSITQVCHYRAYQIKAINVRTNHVHVVVSAQADPALIINSFKSYATRKLRENFLIDNQTKVWARGGSRRYLWKPRFVALAIEYVLYGQGDFIPNLED